MSDFAVGVCGFGRCGSSMAMQMLAAGGLPHAGDTDPTSGELLGGRGIREAWDVELPGRAVKLLDCVLHFGLPPAPGWRFVWLDRDPMEQAKSQLKFVQFLLGGLAEPEEQAVARLVAGYHRDRPRALKLLRAAGPVQLVSYEWVLADPLFGAAQLAFVWPDLDVSAAAAVVHQRDSSCRPDLAFELGGGR